jgi:superfamily II DNA or RNA helicase
MSGWVQIHVGNASSRIEDLRLELVRLLRYELSYLVSEPGVRRHMQPDGSVKTAFWDGYERLMDKKGTFPSGLVPRVCRLLQKWGVGYQIQDHRVRPQEAFPKWTMPSDFALRDYQEAAVLKAEVWGRGVIDSPPRTGKTLMMAELVRRVAAKTVITAPTEPIVRQTYDKLLELFRRNEWTRQVRDCAADFYPLVGGPPKTPEAWEQVHRATVFVATADTAVAMPPGWWDDVVCLITDERHHQAAKTYREINDLARNAYFRWGFTGTNYRSDPSEQVALECCLGRTVASYGIPEMVNRGVLIKGRVEFWPVEMHGLKTAKFADAYRRGIVECEVRNQMVIHAATELQRAGRKVLILVHYIEHGDALAKRIHGSKFVQGEDGAEVRKAVSQLDTGELRCLIGSPVVGEGLDCPAADALIYAKGYKAKVTHTQDTFRVLTALPGKPEAVIVDFADRHNNHLIQHSVERMRNYQSMGLTVAVHDRLPLDLVQTRLY